MVIEIKYHSNEIPRLGRIDKGDWIDLYAAEHVILKRGDHALVSLGVSMKLPYGYEAHLAPRSSTFKKWNIIQTNGVGVIDESYCGTNDVWKMPVYAMDNTEINVGDKIAQFRVERKMEFIDFVEVEELSPVDRGGFGSTGAR